MKRGPLFRLLRLERALCPSCHRDNVWRTRSSAPAVCRWCGSLMFDFAAFTRNVQKLADAFLTAFSEACRTVVSALNAFSQAFAARTWVVDVETATHDDLRAGETVTSVSRVQVIAPDATAAQLVASQIAARPGRMPTRATVVTPAMLEEERLAQTPGWGYRPPPFNPLDSAMRLRRLPQDGKGEPAAHQNPPEEP